MTFNECVQIIFQFEGGDKITNDPDDSGGITRYGISSKAFPSLVVGGISAEQARGIYQSHYWDAVRADELPRLLKLPVFDAAVNMGVRRSIRILQWSVGAKVDGWLGYKTLHRVRSANTFETFLRILSRRMQYYQRLKTFKKYGNGWTRRCLMVARLSKANGEE